MTAPQVSAFVVNEIEHHVASLHKLAVGQDGVLAVAVYGEDLQPSNKHFEVGNVRSMVQEIMRWQAIPNANVYVPLAVLRRDSVGTIKRGGEADVVALLGLVLDLDSDRGKAGSLPPEPRPSIVIETSQGNYQAFYLFERALSRQEAKCLAVDVTNAVCSDHGTKDISHVWRVPGTLNWPDQNKRKRGRSRNPWLVTIKEASGVLVNPQALHEVAKGRLASRDGAAERLEAGSAGWSNQLPVRCNEQLNNIISQKNLILISEPVGQGNRSEHIWKVLRELFAAGLTKNETFHFTNQYMNLPGTAWGHFERNENRLRMEIERVWNKTHREWIDRLKRGEATITVNGKKMRLDQQSPSLPDDLPPPQATPYRWADASSIPTRQFLFRRHLSRGTVSATIAPGGVGKTSLKVVEAVSMASGLDLLRERTPIPQRKVWLINLEDPLDEMQRKVQAVAKYYGLSRESVGDRLFLDTGHEWDFVIATEKARGSGGELKKVVSEAIAEQIKRNQIDVVIIDPFVSSHRVNENDNGAIDLVIKKFARIAQTCGCAIEIVHHTRKPSGEFEVTTESSRGAKALTDACRSVLTINRMNRAEGEKAEVENHRLYFRCFPDKSNLAPPAERSDWYQLVDVDLGNGRLGGPGDRVGVVAPWQWPAPFEAGDISDEDIEAIRQALAGKTFREHDQSPNWVGYDIAKALGIDDPKGAGKLRLKAIVKALVEKGILVIESEKNPRNGRSHKYVRLSN